MNNKKLIILSGACLVLGITWLAGLLGSPEARNARERLAAFDIDVDLNDVQAIHINDLELQLHDNQWYRLKEKDSSQVPARKDRVDILFQSLKDLQGVRTISSNTENSEDYGLDEARTLAFLGDDGEELLTFAFGDAIAGEQSVYATSTGQEGILSVSDSLDYYTQENEFYWTDLRLFVNRPNIDDAQRIEIEQDGETFVMILIRKEDSKLGEKAFEWVIEGEDNLVLDQARAQGIIRTIINLEGSDVMVSDEFAVGNAVGSVAVQTEQSVHSIHLFENPQATAEEDTDSVGAFLAQTNLERAGFYFELSDAVVNRLLRERDYFILDEETVEKIEQERAELERAAQERE